MKGTLSAVVVLAFAAGPSFSADDSIDPKVILDKAITAMGGQDKLGKIHAVQAKTKGTLSIGGAESPINGQTTVQGLDHYRLEFEGEFGGNQIKGGTVIDGAKGWRKFGDDLMALDERSLRGEKRLIYLAQAAGNPTLLKGEGFKIIKAISDKMDGAAVVGLLATGPDGQDFTIYFDKENGLPRRVVAKVTGFTGEEAKQETTYAAYKDFGGIKKATKTESKRDGEPFLKQELLEFKVLDKVAPETFNEPK